MIETSGRILKEDDVELDGHYQLDIEPGNFETSEPVHIDEPVSEPQVRVVENHPEYAVIEVTCCCGAKVCLKCEYSNDEVPEVS
jgi:hypothetical protein